MSDAEWLQQHKKPHPEPRPASPASNTAPAASRAHPGALVIGMAIVLLAGYGYLSKSHQAERTQPPQTVKPATPAPRMPTAAETQARDDQNRAFLKQMEVDFYRKQISGDILKLNDIASRFNDVNQVAASTARIALPQLVQQMQALRREVDATITHPCLAPATADLASAITEITAGYLAFMQSADDAHATKSKQHLAAAQGHLTQYTTHRNACVTW